MHHDFLWSRVRLRLGPEGNAKGHHHRANPRSRAAHPSIRHHSRIFIRHRQSQRSRTRHPRNASIHSHAQTSQSQVEIIMYHYTPVPQRTAMYGDIDGQIAFPTTPDEWATKRWMDFTLRIDPNTPWLKRKTKNLIDNFELVVSSRWPTVQDIRAPRWSRAILKSLSAWRYAFRLYAFPQELRWAH